MLFAISIAVRYSNLTAPLDRREEWQTGHVLTTLKIWEQNGIADHYFSPVWTFNNPGDKITNSLGGIKDKEGYTYYTSYPSFSFILPYVFIKLSGQNVSVSGIRILSLITNFVCAFLIFLITYKFFNRKIKDHIFIPAHIAFCFYVFATGNLWFHGNFYFADSLVHVFILGTIYLLLFIIDQPEKNVSSRNVLLFLLLFFGIYTEWLALFLAGVLLVFFIFKAFKSKIYINYLASVLAATILSLGLTVIQYSYIARFEVLKQHWIEKFNGRNGFNEQAAVDGTSIFHEQSYKDIYSHYLSNYNYLGSFTLLCAFALLIILLTDRKTKKIQFQSIPALIIFFISLAVIIHHVVFFNFTAIHDISTLKTTMPVCLFVGYFFGIAVQYAGKRSSKLINGSAILFCVTFIFFSSREYLLVNSGHSDSYAQKLTGDAAAKYAKPDEMVFTNVGISPVIMWHAQRNLMPAVSLKDCLKTLDSLHFQKGLFLKVSSQKEGFLLKISKVDMNGDTLALN